MDSLAACPPVRSSRVKPSLERQQEQVSVKITAQASTSPHKQQSAASVPLHRVVRPVLKRSGLESMSIPVHSSFGVGTSSFKLSADFNKSSGRDANFSQTVSSSLPPGMPVPTVDIPRLPSREVHQQAMLDTISRLQQDRGLEVDYNGPIVKVSPRSTHMVMSNIEEDGTLTPARRRGQHRHPHAVRELTNIPAEHLRSLPPSPRRPEVPSAVSAFKHAIRERERILRQPGLLSGPPTADCRIGVTESVEAVHLPFINTNSARHNTGALRPVDSTRTIPDAMLSTNSRGGGGGAGNTSLGIGHVERVVSGISARSNASALRSTTSDGTAPQQVDVTQIAITTPPKPTLEGIAIVVEGGDEDSPFGSQKRNSKGLPTLDTEDLALSRQVTAVVEPVPEFCPKSALRKPLTETTPAHIPASPNHGLKGSSLRSVREQLEWHMTTSARALIPLPPPQEPAPKLRATVVDPKDAMEDGSNPGAQFSPRRRQSSTLNATSIGMGPMTSTSRRNSLLSKSESTNRGNQGTATSEADIAAAEALVTLRRNEERMLNSDVAPPQLVRSVGPSGGDRNTKEAIYALSTPRGTRDLFLPAPPPSVSTSNSNAGVATSTSLMANQSGVAWGSFAHPHGGGAVRASPSFKGSPGSMRAVPRTRGNSTTASNFVNGGRLAASPLRPSPSMEGAQVSSGGESSPPPHTTGSSGLGGNSAVAAVIPPISHSGIHSSTALQPVLRRARPMAVIYAGSTPLASSPGGTSATCDTPAPL